MSEAFELLLQCLNSSSLETIENTHESLLCLVDTEKLLLDGLNCNRAGLWVLEDLANVLSTVFPIGLVTMLIDAVFMNG